MNKKKWALEYHPNPEFLAKLGEEFGEACERFGQMTNATDAEEHAERRSQLIQELGHVQFIARCWAVKLAQLEKMEVGNG